MSERRRIVASSGLFTVSIGDKRYAGRECEGKVFLARGTSRYAEVWSDSWNVHIIKCRWGEKQAESGGCSKDDFE